MKLSQQNIIKWLLASGAWTIVASFYTTQALIQSLDRPTPLIWWRVAIWELFFCYIWLALTPIILWLTGRSPLVRGQILRNLSIYFFASIVLSLLHLVVYSAGFPVLPRFFGGGVAPNPGFITIYESFVVAYFHFCLISFWGTLLVIYLLKYYRGYQERALMAAQLEASLAKSQLQILKTELQPHFLFNTLNTISELVHEDGEVADRMISRLSGLLRMSLDTGNAQEVSLREELKFLQHYLDIERARFEERLNVSFAIQPETFDAQVPNMILQPLVENAVRHSVAPRAEGGHICISTKCTDANLRIIVEDDGESLLLDEAAGFKEGIGLSNTRERLKALYGPAHRFELKKAVTGGLTITIEIPFKTVEVNNGR